MAGADPVLDGRVVLVGGAADAARIDDLPAVRKRDQTGDVAVGAEDERFRDPGRQRLDPGGVPQTNMPSAQTSSRK